MPYGKIPKISGIDRIEGNRLSLLQSQKTVVSFAFTEAGNYQIELVCKQNTKNTLFIHNLGRERQTIHLKIQLQTGAQLFCIALFHANKTDTLKVDIQCECEQVSHLHFIGLHTNQGQSDIQVTSTAQGSKIQSNLFCIGIGKGSSSQRVSLVNISNHTDNMGRIINRTVLFDEAQCRQEGLPQIQKQGKNNEYHLEQKTLLLGKKTRIISKPQLFVANKQVQASHSAAISTFPEDDLFYLESRGLDKKQARELAVEGFVQELFQDIPSKNMQACLTENMKKFIENDELSVSHFLK